MPERRRACRVLGALAALLATALGATGCGGRQESSSSTSASAGASANAAASAALDRLAVTAADLGGGFTQQSSGAVPLSGLTANDSRATVFTDGAGGDSVTDVVIVFADATTAHDAYQGGLQDAQKEVATPAVTALPIGPDAKLVRGTRNDKALALVRLREDRVYVEIDFAAPSSRPPPDDLVTRVSTLQDRRIVAAAK